jgi:uncharacterized protein DUF1553/uncharacterized protein DUF1549/concanavalin A-like lectin/glucanase superfamily protein/cytochrome c
MRVRCAPRANIGMLVLAGCLLAGLGMAGEVRAEKLQYNRDIRPILAENCFACHGPDSAARKADLRLDRREVAIDFGSIVPGKPAESELVNRIEASDPKELMPPPEVHKTLSVQQKALLRQWIAEGAEYQPHWSLIAPARGTPPAVKNKAWVRNPIDNFVLAKLEAVGMQPAPEADRRTMARRLSLDLTGLPPAPADVEAFVNDPSADAYEKLVDRLLQSPHWGEHRGRYWLDAARYADTHGIHFDNYREMWSYRDWVIGAFNQNLPFDRFTIEQLAGDLLPNRTLEQQIASGFNRCNITSNEGGLIDEEYLVLYTRDRTETTSQVWLGLTAGCAVCHDHKFDPITQKEFYELAAFFNNTTQAAKDGNIKDTPPIVVVPESHDRERWNALVAQAADVQGKLSARKQSARADFDRWTKEAKPETLVAMLSRDALQLHAPLSDGEGSVLQCDVDGKPETVHLDSELAWGTGHVAPLAWKNKPGITVSLPTVGDFEKDQPFTCAAWVKLPDGAEHGAIVSRMDEAEDYRGWDLFFERGKLASHIVHQWPDNAIKVASKKAMPPGKWHHVAMSYNGSGKAAGVKLFVDGELQETVAKPNALTASIRIGVPLQVGQRTRGDRLDDLLIQDLRIYKRELPPAEVAEVADTTRAIGLAQKPAGKRTPPETNELYQWWLPHVDAPYRELSGNLASVERQQAEVKARGTVAFVMQEQQSPGMAYILNRGEYDQRRDMVKPKTPDALPPLPSDLPRDRLGFAQWLLRPEHPLTARVTVNRFWQEVFGVGLVRTAGDFGVTGEPPSHPELLDWLAVDFRESGWDVKRFFKQLVTSATYRQSALMTPQKREKDPQNRLLSRGPRFRMDAEMVRDYALAASGLLVEKIGGPSTRPYQPEGVWEAVAMIGSNTRDYRQDSGENLYRRSMYTLWKRAAPPASMDIFNAPSREVCTVRRERTNTPLQALVTLNDPQFVEAARQLAQRALKATDDQPEQRVDWIVRRLLSRPLRPDEMKTVLASLDGLLKYYRGNAEDAKKLIAVGESKADSALDAPTLAGWTMLTNELLNLDEVLNK